MAVVVSCRQRIQGRANHYLNCWALANFAAEYYGIKNAMRPEAKEREESGLGGWPNRHSWEADEWKRMDGYWWA